MWQIRNLSYGRRKELGFGGARKVQNITAKLNGARKVQNKTVREKRKIKRRCCRGR